MLTGHILNGQYRLDGELGEGGMSIVTQAVDLESGRTVAIKLLSHGKGGAPKASSRLRHEYEVLSILDHPSVVKVYSWGAAEDGTEFFTMELLKGVTLDDYIRSQAPLQNDVAHKLTILKEVAVALEYLHSKGVAYCDLKPGNIMLTDVEGAKVKVFDFGIARYMENAPEGSTSVTDGAMTGTSYYMSPEQIRGDKVDARSDVYSFGVLAFEMLTGRLPYNQEALFAITASHLIGKVPSARELNHHISPQLDRFIGVCLQKNPNDRYTSMSEVVDRIDVATRRGTGGLMGFLRRLTGSGRG